MSTERLRLLLLILEKYTELVPLVEEKAVFPLQETREFCDWLWEQIVEEFRAIERVL